MGEGKIIKGKIMDCNERKSMDDIKSEDDERIDDRSAVYKNVECATL